MFKKLAVVAALSAVLNVSPVFAEYSNAPLTDSEVTKYEEAMVYVNETYTMGKERPYNNRNLNLIQNTIVGYNSDRLNYKDGVHERYVGVAKIAPYYTGMYTVNSMNGYSIYFSPDIIDFCNQLDSTGLVPLGESYMRDMTRYSVYNSSQLAFLVAHEMGHGYDNDFRDTVNEMGLNADIRRLTEKDVTTWTKEDAKILEKIFSNREASIRSEYRADMTALDFVSRQGVYSGAGGAMMFFHRYGNYEAKNQDMVVDRVANAHPETSVRMERVKQYVISRSNGRVHPNDDGTFTFDGRLVSPPRLYDAESVDRAYYAAAQLAEAIHYGGYIDIVNLNDETYGNQYASDAKLAIAVCDDDVKNRQNFITVDRVGIDAKRAETLLRKKDSPKNDEEKYFMQMIKIVNKVTTK